MADSSNNNGRFSNIQASETNSVTNGTTFLQDKLPNATSLFDYAEPEGLRWNKSYPYQLLVVENTSGGWKAKDNWKFTLPMSPQAIDIDMPFAITASATLGGVIEEHNGAPFRIIQLSGTTGVLPLKGTPDPSFVSKLPAPTRTVLAGTIIATSNLVSDLTRGTLLPAGQSNVVPESEFQSPTSSISKTSGYYQYHQLRIFLENYAQVKKTAEGKALRLAFAMWKDKSVYLVTPINFKTSRGADSPFEYRYHLSFKAWSRITLDSVVNFNSYTPVSRDPNILADIINKVDATRAGMENARGVLQALRADINTTLFTPLREVSLGLKSMSGLTKSLADYPENIIRDFKESFLVYFPSSGNKGILSELSEDLRNSILELSKLSGKAETGSSRYDSLKVNALNGAHPVNKIFDNPSNYYSLFSNIDPSSFRTPVSLQLKMKEEETKTKSFSRKDFELRRDMVKSVLADFCESVGAGSSTYSKVFNITERGSSVTKTASEDDYDIIFELNNAVMELNRLCVSSKMDADSVSAIDYIAGLAKQSGIAFTTPQSKILVPLPYGHTLEQMAALYLGDANRWHEIATLNGLREPYIDEVGFDIPLSTNGSLNSIQVSNAANLYTGQSVYISSTTQKPEKRRITGINKISETVNVVSLSGNADLDKFTVEAGSGLHTYLPDTANSQMSIYIPSKDAANEEDFQAKAIPGIDYFDNLVRVGGISLLLNQYNDIVFAPNGSTRLSVGMTNIIQKSRIALATPKGSLLQHKNYGLPVQAGMSTADVSANEILKSIKDMFSKDSSFSDVLSASVVKDGPVSRITINVEVAGVSQVVPITAEIRH